MATMLKRFTENLLASGLMSAEEWRGFRAQLPTEPPLTVERVVEELVRQGKLTRYQATRIVDGKPHGLILGNNVILDRIGVGGMGEVFKAEHRRMKRIVVVKLLHPEHTKSEMALRRFQREVEAAAKLTHPNIVTAFDADEANGIHFLVMEYIDGVDLGRLVSGEGPLDIKVALDFMIQAARGLAYAHSQGVVHRDIKPSNLLVDTAGVVKVLDLGLARIDSAFVKHGTSLEDEEGLTEANTIIGTLDYMAPEQADSARVDRRADVYSLGCTLHRLLTGHPPYRGDSVIEKLLAHRTQPIPSLRTSCPDASEHLDHVFQRMIAKTPDERYATMEDLLVELEQCLKELRAPPSALHGRRDQDQAGQADDEVTRFGAEATDALVTTEDTRPTPGAPLSPVRRRGMLAVGIDLGTTYSAVAYLDERDRPQTLANSEGDKITPSVLLFEEDGVIVGKEAVKATSTDMDKVAECAKRDLGQRFFHKPLLNQWYPPEVLQAYILNKLRKDSWELLGRFDKVVITVPAYFDEVRRKATQDAGYMAGFEVLDIINEPVAAALAFGLQQGYLQADGGSGQLRRIVVFDLGGGTFDVAVMEIGGGQFKTLATDGDLQLGGLDWGQRLVDYVAEEFIRTWGCDPRDDANLVGRVWRECEEAKRALSVQNKTHIVCDYRGQTRRVPITREQFEAMTQDLLERMAKTTEQTIRAAGLSWPEIDRILLVGAATHMPAVPAMLQRISGKTPDCSVSPDEAVAHGAALHAGWLLDRDEGKTTGFRVQNVNSHSLGVVGVDPNTKCKQTAILIPRNTPLPVLAKKVFKTSKIGQRSVLVEIVEGESALADECVQIGRCAIRSLPPNLPARTPVEVVFRYEENGRLTVQVRIANANAALQHQITRDNMLTQEQLDNWREHVSGLPPAANDPNRAAQAFTG
ncbi:MAG: Hsp70 family protein [Planctomycetota bacterium]|nr:Hsp70 family protein [Planctomycetota bacterium]